MFCRQLFNSVNKEHCVYHEVFIEWITDLYSLTCT